MFPLSRLSRHDGGQPPRRVRNERVRLFTRQFLMVYIPLAVDGRFPLLAPFHPACKRHVLPAPFAYVYRALITGPLLPNPARIFAAFFQRPATCSWRRRRTTSGRVNSTLKYVSSLREPHALFSFSFLSGRTSVSSGICPATSLLDPFSAHTTPL